MFLVVAFKKISENYGTKNGLTGIYIMFSGRRQGKWLVICHMHMFHDAALSTHAACLNDYDVQTKTCILLT